jgi:hypothetical protein
MLRPKSFSQMSPEYTSIHIKHINIHIDIHIDIHINIHIDIANAKHIQDDTGGAEPAVNEALAVYVVGSYIGMSPFIDTAFKLSVKALLELQGSSHKG